MLGKGLIKFMSAESDLILSVRLGRREEDGGGEGGLHWVRAVGSPVSHTFGFSFRSFLFKI